MPVPQPISAARVGLATFLWQARCATRKCNRADAKLGIGETRRVVYHARPTLRWLIVFGSLGLAGLAPGRERLSAWLVVGLVCLPVALLELGAELATSSTTTRWRAVGVRCQLAAATIFPSLLIAGASIPAPSLRGKPFLVALGSLGALASAIVWWDHGRAQRGRDPLAGNPVGAGERVASRGGLVDALAVIGGMPFLLGAISAAFVALALVAIARHRGAVPSDVWLGLVFFTACLLVAVMKGMQRWEAFVPDSRIAGWRLATQTTAFLLFGGALVAIALAERREGTAGPVKVLFMAGVGALCMFGGTAFIWLPRLRSRRGVGYHLAREGLVETTRGAAFLFPWSAIESVAIGEQTHQVTLFVRLARPDLLQGPWRSGLLVADAAGGRRRSRRLRSLMWSRFLFEADVFIMAPLVDRPLGDLFREISSLLENEEERASLPPMLDAKFGPS